MHVISCCPNSPCLTGHMVQTSQPARIHFREVYFGNRILGVREGKLSRLRGTLGLSLCTVHAQRAMYVMRAVCLALDSGRFELIQGDAINMRETPGTSGRLGMSLHGGSNEEHRGITFEVFQTVSPEKVHTNFVKI